MTDTLESLERDLIAKIGAAASEAALSDRNLERLARRARAGLARTGAAMTNGSGDYVIALSTAVNVRRTAERPAKIATIEDLPNDLFSPLSEAAIEATEEAILNSLFMAETTEGFNIYAGAPSRVEALPLDRVREILRHEGRD